MSRRFRILGTLVSVTLTAMLWLLFAPAQLGGSVRMLGIQGTSMEPNLHAGDLVFVRESTYEVGDVVAYRGELVDAILLHRIIAIEDGRYSLQGDNNDFVDPDRPTLDRIVGEQILRIPNGAHVLRGIADPKVVAALLGLSVFALILRRRPSGTTPRTRSITMPTTLRSRFLAAGAAPGAPAAAVALVALGFAAVGVGAAAVAAPERAAAEAGYSHQGTFSYTAETPRSIYPDGVADTGEAIFLDVAPTAAFGFAYGFVTDADRELAGRIALRATISDAAGWTRVMTLQPETPFTGEAAAASATVDLQRLRRIIMRVQTQTGVARTIYQVTLQPAVELTGTVAGAAFKQAFTPSLTLEYDGRLLRYVAQPDATTDPLAPTMAGTVAAGGAAGAATLTLAGRTFPARPLAAAMAILATISAVIAWVLFAAARRARELDVPARMRARFADRIVELEHLPARATIAVVDAGGFEKLAVASEEPILEHEDRYGISWLLRDGEFTYRFHVSSDPEHAIILSPEFTRVGAVL